MINIFTRLISLFLVLAALSLTPYLITIHKIHLQGVHHEELKSILQFIYLGEATFYQERMNEFMNVAKDLDIKEIEENIVDDGDESKGNENVEIQQQNTLNVTSVSIGNLQPKNNYNSSLDNNKKHACEQCDYKSKQKVKLITHVQAVHEGIKFPCTYCNYKATQLSNLKTHIKAKHLGVKFPCTQCDYKGSSSSTLYFHVRSKHKN